MDKVHIGLHYETYNKENNIEQVSNAASVCQS